MSENKQSQGNPKDAFSIYQQNIDKLFAGARQSIPQYHQSITNVQQEYMQAFENVLGSAVTMQKEFAKKAGMATAMPDATIKAVRDTTDEFVKATSIQNQMVLATIDAAQQNIKTFNDNAKSFAELNRNIVQSWISAFVTRNN